MTNFQIAFKIVRDLKRYKSLKERYGRDWVLHIEKQLNKLDEEQWSKKFNLCMNTNCELFIVEIKEN
jgi:hypothetical protein